MLKPDEVIMIKVSDFEKKYISRQLFDALREERDGIQMKLNEVQEQSDTIRRKASDFDRVENLYNEVTEENARLREAIFLNGGGSVYLEEFGRLCSCSGCGIGETRSWNKGIHSTTCDMLNSAYFARQALEVKP